MNCLALGLRAPLRALGSCIAFASLLALAGCPTQHQEVQTYRRVIAGTPAPSSYQPGQALSLTQALELANLWNEQIGLQGENYLQAIIAKDRAVAAFLPTVAFQPNFTIEQAPGANTSSALSNVSQQATASAGGFVIRGDTWQRTEAPVTAGMNLSFVSYPNIQSAEQNIIQQRQYLLDAQATLFLSVAQTYYQVLLSEQQVAVLESSLKLQQARLVDAESRFRNHLALALEVSQTRAELASTQASLTQAQSDVRNARHMLAYLIGVSEVDGPLIDDAKLPDHLPAVDDFRLYANAHREDLLGAASAVRSARYSVNAAISEYYPSVSLNVAGFLYREYFSDASKWDAILIGNLPIFSAGIIEADVRDAWSRLRQAALYQSELMRQIDRDVQVSYENLQSAERQLPSLQEEVNAAQDALQQSQQMLNNQLAIPLDVLTAQQTLLSAQLTYSNEVFSRTIYYFDLLRISGQFDLQTPQKWRGTTRPSSVSSAF